MSIFGHITTRNRVNYNTGTEEPEEMIIKEDHVATGFANFWRKLTGSHLTTADIEANQFSAQQAELAFDREVEFYEKYLSIGAQVQQMRDAGINPFGAAGVNSGNGVRSASPSSVSPTSGSLGFNPLDFVLGIFNLRNQKRLADAEIKLKDAEANKLNVDSDISLKKMASEIANLDSSTQLNIQKVLESATSIDKIKSDMNLNDNQAELFASQVNYLDSQANYINAVAEPESRLKRAQAVIAEWQERNKELFKGLEIGSDVLSSLSNIGLGILSNKTKIDVAKLK